MTVAVQQEVYGEVGIEGDFIFEGSVLMCREMTFCYHAGQFEDDVVRVVESFRYLILQTCAKSNLVAI